MPLRCAPAAARCVCEGGGGGGRRIALREQGLELDIRAARAPLAGLDSRAAGMPGPAPVARARRSSRRALARARQVFYHRRVRSTEHLR